MTFWGRQYADFQQWTLPDTLPIRCDPKKSCAIREHCLKAGIDERLCFGTSDHWKTHLEVRRMAMAWGKEHNELLKSSFEEREIPTSGELDLKVGRG